MPSLTEDQEKQLLQDLYYQDHLPANLDTAIAARRRYYKDVFTRLSKRPQAVDHLDKVKSIVDEMRRQPGATRADIDTHISILGVPEADDRKILLDAILRVWLMIDPDLFSPKWTGATRLCDCVYGTFYPGKKAPDFPLQTPPAGMAVPQTQSPDHYGELADIRARMTHPMTAVNLDGLTNIHIKFDTLLTQHLELDEESRSLNVFVVNAWLIRAVEMAKTVREPLPQPAAVAGGQPPAPALPAVGGGQAAQTSLPPFPIPIEILRETILSLDMLFPRRQNASTLSFLEKKAPELHLFRTGPDDLFPPKTGPPWRVDVRHLDFYRDRAVELAYDFLNPPRDWSTIRRDFRNPVQYYTFWIGLVIFVATLVFGIVASVLAGLQFYWGRAAVMGTGGG